MADAPTKMVFVDLAPPHELVINRIINTAYFGSQVSLVLGGNRIGISAEGNLQAEGTISR